MDRKHASTCRIDNLARLLEGGIGRRRTLVAAGSALVATMLGRAPAGAGCKKVGKKCDENNDCCNGSRCKGDKKDKKGKCRCKGGFITCARACCPASSQECVAGICVTPPGGCPPGADSCASEDDFKCGGSLTCECSRSTEGQTLCGDQTTEGAVCGQCETSADCASFGPGAFCAVSTNIEVCCGPDAQNVCRLPCPT